MKKHSLAGTQRDVSVQAVPSSHAGAHGARPTGSRNVTASRELDDGRSRNCYILSQNSIHRATETVVPVLLRSAQVCRVESAHDKVAFLDIVDGTSGFDNFTTGVGTRNDHILDGERV